MSTDAGLLKSLSDLIVRDGEPVRLRRSQYIVRRGERPHSLFLIQEGWAARYRILRDGRRHISQFYTPGDVCDSSWLLSGEAGHSVLALTPLRGVALDREAAELRFGRDAEFSRRVASESLSRLEARSEEHTSELQSLMRISYAVFCLKKKNRNKYKQNKRVTRIEDRQYQK